MTWNWDMDSVLITFFLLYILPHYTPFTLAIQDLISRAHLVPFTVMLPKLLKYSPFVYVHNIYCNSPI